MWIKSIVILNVKKERMAEIKNQKQLITRIRRVEGQVRGIERMIEDGREFSDLVVQLQAVKSAVLGIIQQLIEDRLNFSEEGLKLAPEDISTLLRLLKS